MVAVACDTATMRRPIPTPSALKLARERARITQAQLAQQIGRHPASVGLAERGALSLDMAQRCAAALGCRPEDLLGKGQP